MKKLMLGNDAVARGLYEGGLSFASSYPGTPSTEITEALAKYDDVYSEWASNEKVAAEAAFGASVAGARSFCAMKHVGLNVAADLLYTASYTGVNGGFVIAVADDPGMHSSQNEQDSRHHAIASKAMMIEPSDSAECLEFAKKALALSERFDTPIILRLSTRVSHSQSIVTVSERDVVPMKKYEKNIGKYVMMPGNAIKRHVAVEERLETIKSWAENCELNKTEINGSKTGIITSGISYQYAKEALGDGADYLKLGVINPLPENIIKEFCASHETVWVLEELDDIIETHCKKLGLEVKGKQFFSLRGEYTATEIKRVIKGETVETVTAPESAPVRPPVMCPGCPHRGVFYVLSKLKLYVSGDIGCYTLGAAAPLSAIDTTICMGASVSMLHGFNVANKNAGVAAKSVAVIGDSTFIHSGITGLIDIAYNRSNSTVIILDNSITGMTGHQQNPTTGKTIKGDPTAAVSLEALVKAIGIELVSIVDPFDVKTLEAKVKEYTSLDAPSVIICRRPCALLKYVKPSAPVTINSEKCVNCGMCLKAGCPAIVKKDGKMQINPVLCTGCGLCEKICAVGAIVKEAK
ncbi:MAG: indolepyruvate ferredoxin oxidoreductase subunit alpha [Clostridia bacterium]|nr:indolepyruvate ferredoxin oxidoreductase subunit alpha [Clostridia bacterium]